jgi:hypothetical protein
VLGLGGLALIVAPRQDWQTARARPGEFEGETALKPWLVGLAMIGVIWIVIAVAAVT